MADDHLAFAMELALDAGAIIRREFNQVSNVTYKTDGSPVTEVDTQVNQMVIDRIRNKYPAHGLLGEEQNLGTGAEPYRWICDPLDGTLPYVLGVPNSLFMLALVGEPGLLLAVAYDPFAYRLYHATRRGGAFCDRHPVHVSAQPWGRGRVVLSASARNLIEAVTRAAGRVELASGTGHKCMMVARGEAVGTIKETADFHDIAPAALIVVEAGGQVTALDGSPMALDREIQGGVIISNGLAHQKLVEVAEVVAAG
jgi:myo-inositol-1(or 4)-monophosphatase